MVNPEVVFWKLRVLASERAANLGRQGPLDVIEINSSPGTLSCCNNNVIQRHAEVQIKATTSSWPHVTNEGCRV